MPIPRAVILHRLVRAGLVLFVVGLAGRHWHPYYGFTRFLQMDAGALAAALPELRGAPIFAYENGYDGHYYAQLAARPAVNDPALAGGFDNLGYRARRILLSWVAWVVGGGDGVAAARAYAWLNLVLWAGLAALLGRIFPCMGWRETLAWVGVLFSAGVLHSVRLGLTDLLALLLVAGAVFLAENNRRGAAAALLGLGGLARETALLGVVTLWPPGKPSLQSWVRAAGWAALCVVPLAAWLWYLRSVLGPTEPGLGNFAAPLAGWAGKWAEMILRLRTEPDRYLVLTGLLAHAGLTVQAVFLLARPQPADRWWRLGAVYAGLLLVLGPAVWEGHPGAATRVLLPLALAFNVLAARGRVGAAWLVAGNLPVLAGVLAFWTVPQDPHELAAGRASAGAYVVQADARWHAAEHGRNRTWAWCPQAGGIELKLWPRADAQMKIQVAVRGLTARPLEIRQDGRVLWRGDIGEKLQWVTLPVVTLAQGRARLELSSSAAPAVESAAVGARPLGFAIYGVRVD
ncbi:MAG: hypothetical protein HYX71_04505 [Opitutae bacterium]|nr:hypothetical protein [Opitutae bacterium]